MSLDSYWDRYMENARVVIHQVLIAYSKIFPIFEAFEMCRMSEVLVDPLGFVCGAGGVAQTSFSGSTLTQPHSSGEKDLT